MKKRKMVKKMKSIIIGKKYDTDTARWVGNWGRGYEYDINYISEDLYCKRTGEYFLYGEGGPCTEYSVAVSNSTWSSGCCITPLSVAEAKEWAEEHLSGDAYEEEFGEVEE